MGSRGERSTRRIALVLVVALSVVLAGCAGVGSDGADAGNGNGDGAESPAEEQSEDGTDETDDAEDEPVEASDPSDEEGDDGDEPATTDESESADALDEDAEDTAGGESAGATDADDVDDADENDADGASGNSDDTNAEGTLEVHAIDVGQADATLLIGPEETMLIDSGDWRNDGDAVIAYLESRGIERIDYLVTTHPHADHIGGHAAVIEHYETEHDGVDQVWDPGIAHTSQTYENYLDAVEEHDVDLIRAQEGDEIPFEGADVQLFNPPTESGSDDLHYNSTTVHVEHGDRSFLFTGDAEADAEGRMVDEHGDALGADVYQAGHHGSSTSSTDPFLDRVDPEYAIVSSAYESQYGHPHDEVLAAFDERGIETYWTAVHGSIVVESDGEELSIEAASDATTEPSELREEPPADAEETAALTTPPTASTVGPSHVQEAIA